VLSCAVSSFASFAILGYSALFVLFLFTCSISFIFAYFSYLDCFQAICFFISVQFWLLTLTAEIAQREDCRHDGDEQNLISGKFKT